MKSAERRTGPRKKKGFEPPLNAALLIPDHGPCSEEEFLWLDNNGPRRLIELVDGFLEVLPMPDLNHQRLLKFLFGRLNDHVNRRHLGEALFAPLPIRLWEKHLREPDVVFFKAHRLLDPHTPPEGADLVMEIVSPDKKNRERDLKVKPKAYAKAKIPEYWIVDPETKTITVLVLGAKTYKVHGKFKMGDDAQSKILPGFSVAVAEVFAAGVGHGA